MRWLAVYFSSICSTKNALVGAAHCGARVQMLDLDYGGWFSLIVAEDLVRRDFLAALEGDPPAAVLLTNSQWPQPDGFDAADRWPELAALLASRYVFDQSKNKNGIAWRLYLRRPPPD